MPSVRVDYEKIIRHHVKILEQLHAPSGLFRASAQTVATGYDKAWLRDTFYECLAFEFIGRWDVVQKTYRALLDLFLIHEKKIDKAIKKKPIKRNDYIHARFHPETFEEFNEGWGNKQNDSIGAILFRIGELEQHDQYRVIKTANDKRIVQKLVNYLASIEYWHDADNGMWEENEEVHASSVGACVAGLKKIASLDYIDVDPELIAKGEETLAALLPRESEGKFVDLSLLSLIFPYSITTPEQTENILRNVEYHLLRDHGVIRYKNDRYYNADPVDGYSQEAEWTFGLAWLAIIYERLGNRAKATEFIRRSMGTVNSVGEIPELYYSHSEHHNENTPLGWSESMFIVAMHLFYARFVKPDEDAHKEVPAFWFWEQD